MYYPSQIHYFGVTSMQNPVHVGELLHITDHGFERLHKAPRALFRVG